MTHASSSIPFDISRVRHAPNAEAPPQEMSVDDLIEQVHAGAIDPADVSADDRQRCVAHLTRAGLTAEHIAALFHVNERTVQRDRTAIRRAEAIAPTLSLGDEFLGEFYSELRQCNQNLARLTSDDNQPLHARIWAEEARVRNYKRFLDVADRLGYLEGGKRRLDYQRLTDPDDIKRAKELLTVQRKRLLPG